MAVKNGKELLSKIQDTESRNVQEVFRQVQQLKFDENDEATKSTIRAFYDNITSQKFTETELLMLMSSLNQMSEFSCFVLGRLLREKDNSIKKNYNEWVMYGKNSETKPAYRTINGFLDKHEIGISSTKAYYCMDLYDRYSIDDVLRLGVQKTLATVVVKNDEYRSSVIEKATEENWSSDQIRAVSQAISQVEKLDDEKEKKKLVASILKTPDLENIEEKVETIKTIFSNQTQEHEEEKTRIFKRYAFNVELPGDNDKQIIITAKTKKQRDYINKALIYYERAIKNYINKCETMDE